MKLTSSEEIIARVIRDFKPNNMNWKASAYDWIADAMLAINSWYSFETKEAPVAIFNHKGAYPCDLIELIGVKYKGCKLPLGKNIGKIHCQKLFNCNDVMMDITNYEKVVEVNQKIQYLAALQSSYDATQDPTILEEIVTVTKQISNYTIPYAVSGYNNHGLHYYNLQPGAIETTFDFGEITLIYTGATSDDRGMPLLPDVYEFKEAIAWYIMSRMLLSGYEHPVLNWQSADERWEKFRFKAKNKLKMPTLDRMQALANMWTSPVFNRDLPSRFFEGAENITYTDETFIRSADGYWRD